MNIGDGIKQKEFVRDDYGMIHNFEWDGIVARIEKTFYEVEFKRDESNRELSELVQKLLRENKLANNHRTYAKMKIKNYKPL